MSHAATTRALCGGVALLALATQTSAGDAIDQRDVAAIPAVAGEAYEVEFTADEGVIVTGKKGRRYYAHSFVFDLVKDEEIGCWVQADTDIVYIPAERIAGKEEGGKGIGSAFGLFGGSGGDSKTRPGWKEYKSRKVKGNGKVKKCGFDGKIKEAGRYDLTFLSGQPGTMRVYFHNDALEVDKGTAGFELGSARAVSAREMSLLPPMASGRPTHMGAMPAGGEAWVATKPEKLRRYYEALLRDGEYNAVGNFAKLGVAAMSTGEYAIAEWALDRALDRIEAIYAKDEVAKAARSKFTEESIKDFKGDPYERAMAYYYRGLLYLREGDFGNARASFATAEYQDTISEAEEYQSDFGLMNYLAGWSARCMGNEALAEDGFAAAEKMDEVLSAPDPAHRTLILAESGQGPVKMRRGKGMQLVGVFASHAVTGPDAEAPTIANGNASFVRAADISYQGMTRGGRPFDAIMNGKVAFKNTMGTIADVSTIVSVGSTLFADQLGGLGGIGGLGGLFGSLGGDALSDATKAGADVRYWDSLPDAVYVTTAKAAPLAKIGFAQGRDAPSRMVSEPDLRCQLVWASDRDLASVPAGLAGTPMEARKWREKKDGAQARDDAFRTALMAEKI